MPPPPNAYKFYEGDGRGFSYSSKKFRIEQRAHVSFDSANPVVTLNCLNTNDFGVSRGFHSAIDTGETECSELFRYELDPEGLACQGQAQSGENGNLLAVSGTQNAESVNVYMSAKGKVACFDPEWVPSPYIDSCLTIHLRRTREGNGPWFYEYMLAGSHDQFPWHELYINQEPVHLYSPCTIGATLLNLLGGCADEDAVPFSSTPIWLPVPGL